MAIIKLMFQSSTDSNEEVEKQPKLTQAEGDDPGDTNFSQLSEELSPGRKSKLTEINEGEEEDHNRDSKLTEINENEDSSLETTPEKLSEFAPKIKMLEKKE
jgi:hypothetical protein